jgi:hypothetical protein
MEEGAMAQLLKDTIEAVAELKNTCQRAAR